jgi:hypothetical protein
VGGSRRLRGEPVEHGLDVPELRDAGGLEAVFDSVLLCWRGGQLVGNQHRHLVPASAGQRDRDEQVVGGPVDLVHRPDAVARRQVPVDLHIAEHVLLGKGVARELQSQTLADGAVRAVAPDEIVRPHLRLAVRPAEHGRDAVGVLGEAQKPDAAFDPAAELGEPVGEQPLRLVLRQRDESVGHIGRKRELDASDLSPVHEEGLAVHRGRGVERAREHTGRLPQLQGARLDTDRLGIWDGGGQPVDHPAARASAAQLERRSEPDGASANDQHLGVGHVRPPSPIGRTRVPRPRR